MKLSSAIFALSVLGTGFIQAAPVSIECSPGQLLVLLGEEAGNVSELTLTGSFDVRDMETMRSALPALKTLDLSAADISSYRSENPDWMNRCYFSADTLPAYSFHNAGFSAIKLPASLLCIGEGAFAGCPALHSVTFGNKLDAIGDWAFISTAVTEVTLPSVSEMGKGVFENCTQLERADLSEVKFRTLPERTFAGATALTLVSLADGVSVIGPEAFLASGLREIDLSGIPEVGDFAFADSRLRSVNLDDAVVSKGEFFNNISLPEIKGTVSEVGDAAFAGCTALYKAYTVVNAESLGDWALADTAAPQIYLGENLRKVGNNAFSRMSHLAEIDVFSLGSNIPETADNAFDGLRPNEIVLHVKADSENLWKTHPVWGLFNITTDKTGIVSLVNHPSIPNIYFDRNNLVIEGTEIPRHIIVTDQDARIIAEIDPEFNKTVIDTSASTSRIFIARIDIGGEAGTIKILRPLSE